MEIVTQSFTETLEYKKFEIGEKVCLPNCPAQILTVSDFHEPTHAGDMAIVFFEGHSIGFTANNYVPAIETNLKYL